MLHHLSTLEDGGIKVIVVQSVQLGFAEYKIRIGVSTELGLVLISSKPLVQDETDNSTNSVYNIILFILCNLDVIRFLTI